MGKLSNLLNLRGSSGKSREDSSDVSTLLHRDDPKLILLVDPDEESLLVVVEDASALRPVSVETNCFKEAISLLEKEVVCDELSLLLLGHGTKRVECASKFSLE